MNTKLLLPPDLPVHDGIVLEDRQQHRLPDRLERIGDGAAALGLALGGKARIGLDPASGCAR
ncbi:MAG: hypothetical protein IPM60_09390 [Rhodospirillales bacterium]|nr:hypothetical protein [Rhodospirillales bacterium]